MLYKDNVKKTIVDYVKQPHYTDNVKAESSLVLNLLFLKFVASAEALQLLLTKRPWPRYWNRIHLIFPCDIIWLY